MGVVPSLLTLLKSSGASPLASEDIIGASPFLAGLSVIVLVTLSAGNMPVKVIISNTIVLYTENHLYFINNLHGLF